MTVKELSHRDTLSAREKGCAFKVRFASDMQAAAAAGRAQSQHGVRTWFYGCRHCGGFHLTTL